MFDDTEAILHNADVDTGTNVLQVFKKRTSLSQCHLKDFNSSHSNPSLSFYSQHSGSYDPPSMARRSPWMA